MNKILKCLMFVALMAVTFTSCREDAELVSPGTPGHPEQEIVGTYNGTWTVDVTGQETKQYSGTLTFEAGDAAYITNVKAVCPESSLDRSSVANVVKNSAGYRFFNELATNEIGAAFSGNITSEGVATINFQILQKSGKKSLLFTYSFTGTK